MGEVPVPDNMPGISLKQGLGWKFVALFLRKNSKPIMNKQLNYIIGISAMDIIVIIILGLENDPGCSGHTNKGSDRKQSDFGKLASPNNSFFVLFSSLDFL